MQSFNFVDIILFLGVSQGLFLSLSLRLIHNRNKSANKVLSLLLLIAVLMLFGRIAAFRIPEDWVWRFGVLVDTTIFLFGPLIYIYVRRLIYSETPKFQLNWWHFIPSMLHLGYYFWTLSIPLSVFNTLYAKGNLNLMFFIVEASGLVSFIFYWMKAFLMVKEYALQREKQLSFRPKVFQFLKFLLLTLFIFVVLWLASFLSVNFIRKPFALINYEIMWVSTPLFIYLIGFFSLRQPEIFRINFHKKTKIEKDRLKRGEIQRLQKRLNYFISEERVFLEPNLTMKELAEKLNTSSNDLSWLLNQIYQFSFYDFVNSHRIKEFILKVEKNEHHNHTLLALAMDVGFNSKSTFNKAFKAYTGHTPSSYIKSKNVA